MSRQFLVWVLMGSVVGVGVGGCQEVPEGPYPYGEPAMGSYREEAAEVRPAPGPSGGGTLLGGSGSFIVGQLAEKADLKEAERVSKEAKEKPATPAQARQSATADLNKDGFVTLDEVIAMSDAGLDDREIVKRLRATGQIFQVTTTQEEYLLNHGVNRTIADRLRKLNQPASTQTGL